jgi:Zn-dependent peptidase ImmA (M78 family)
MPASQIRSHLSLVNLQKLASMKPYWRVSMNSLLYRAAELGAIDQRTKSYLWMKMGQAGYRTHEPVQIPDESPTLLAELLRIHEETLGYSPKSIDKILCEEGAFSDHRVSRKNESGLRLVQ